jgi:phosphate transport system permease protein
VIPSQTRYRRLKSNLIVVLMGAMVALCLIPLGSLLFTLVSNGIFAFNADFFTKVEGAVGDRSGVIHAIVGSLLHMLMSTLFAVPFGLAIGIFLARPTNTRLANITRLLLDVLAGVPAILIGVFIYTVVVRPLTGFSLLAGGMALALIMLPIFVRGTEQAILGIPMTVDEAGLALGLPAYRVLLRIVLRAAIPAVMTGLFLALARIGGEAAPLLMTSFGNRTWSSSPMDKTASLPVLLFNYAKSGFEEQNRQAWGAAMVLVIIILGFRLLTRLYNRWQYGHGVA